MVARRTPLLELEEPTSYAKKVAKTMAARAARKAAEEEVIRVRLPTKAAQAVQADPAAAVKAMAKHAEEELAKITQGNKAMGQKLVDGKLVPEPPNEAGISTGWPANEDPTQYTPWFVKDQPFWDGFYDVTDHKTGTLSARWWWDGIWCKGEPGDKVATRLRHDQFITQYAWRGLHHDTQQGPYPAPPYNPARLPPGVPIMGKYLLRRAAMEA